MKTLTLRKEDIYTGNLLLVNASHPLTQSGENRLISMPAEHEEIWIDRGAATALSYIFKELECSGKIVPVSGFRSSKEQRRIYFDSIKKNGKEFTENYVALPHCSEHQTGLALDLALKKEEIDFIRPDFPYEGICNKFRKTALKYGFIERYQKGKEQLTGIGHEPWHFRFVGYPHSEIMGENGLCLEEYIQELKRYPYEEGHYSITGENEEIEIFFLPIHSAAEITIGIPENSYYQISGNNMDGVIITLWRQKK